MCSGDVLERKSHSLRYVWGELTSRRISVDEYEPSYTLTPLQTVQNSALKAHVDVRIDTDPLSGFENWSSEATPPLCPVPDWWVAAVGMKSWTSFQCNE